ncbi:MAG: hypothetical protein VB070_11635 [Clostridiaceae bacterium]|nr:hypothetical protein [Clostridiaceae bacterium]
MSNDTLFRKSSLDSISSPEQLNDYIKVSNPSVWLVLAALFVMLAAVFVWGFTGSLPTTVSAKGVVSEGCVLCYISSDDADKISAGQKASIKNRDDSNLKGQVSGVGDIPLSAAEIASELNSDYLVQKLVQGEFAVKITIAPDKTDLADGTLLDVSIVTDSVRPIDFLLK